MQSDDIKTILGIHTDQGSGVPERLNGNLHIWYGMHILTADSELLSWILKT